MIQFRPARGLAAVLLCSAALGSSLPAFAQTPSPPSAPPQADVAPGGTPPAEAPPMLPAPAVPGGEATPETPPPGPVPDALPNAAAPAEPVNPVAQEIERMRGPGSVAELAEDLLPAVVNISTSQDVEAAGRGPRAQDGEEGTTDESEEPQAAPAPETGPAEPDSGPEQRAEPGERSPDESPLQDYFDDLFSGENGAQGRRLDGMGSGFVIDPAGIIVTNNHVIADADEITVNFSDGSSLEATLVGVDPKTDIAVLKVEPEKPLDFVEFGDSENIRIGDWVMAIGNPFGFGGSVSLGIVSARDRNINAGPYDNFIQTDAAINRGNSGGPLFNMDGEVIGINTAIVSPTGGSIGIGFSIPALLAKNVVDQLREFGETRRGWLGIRLQAVTDDIARGLRLPDTKGAVVMGVIEGGPADTGEIKVGDVITSFDGREVATSRDLPLIVAETPVGKRVPITILRKESADDAPPIQVTVEITLGRLEDGEKQAAEAGAAATPEPGTPGEEEGVRLLGMSIEDMSDALRTRFSLAENAEGVVVTEVAPASAAAEKGIEAGTRLTEVAQEPVSSAQEVREKIDELKAAGRKNALLLLSSATGDLRFVVLPLE